MLTDGAWALRHLHHVQSLPPKFCVISVGYPCWAGVTEKDLGTRDSALYRFLHHPNLLLQSTSVRWCDEHLSHPWYSLVLTLSLQGHFVLCRTILGWDREAEHKTVAHFMQTATPILPRRAHCWRKRRALVILILVADLLCSVRLWKAIWVEWGISFSIKMNDHWFYQQPWVYVGEGRPENCMLHLEKRGWIWRRRLAPVWICISVWDTTPKKPLTAKSAPPCNTTQRCAGLKIYGPPAQALVDLLAVPCFSVSSRISVLWGLGRINQVLVTSQQEWNKERESWQSKMEFIGAAGTHTLL